MNTCETLKKWVAKIVVGVKRKKRKILQIAFTPDLRLKG